MPEENRWRTGLKTRYHNRGNQAMTVGIQMCKFFFSSVLMLWIIAPGIAQNPVPEDVRSNPAHAVYLLGNFADIPNPEAYVLHLERVMQASDVGKTLLLTGDLVDNQRPFQEELGRLDSFFRHLERITDLKIIVLPGDRDWDHSGRLGWDHVRQLDAYFKSRDYNNASWPLENGCPGPERINLTLTLNLIVINTQWWNHPWRKPRPESAVCSIASEEAFLEELADLIEETRFGNILIAGHYPIHSNGPYGGHFPLSKWLLPVPVVSTFLTAYKQNIGTPEDICNARFEECVRALDDLLFDHQTLIYASGHDKHIEVLNKDGNCFVNSGAPVWSGFVKKTKETAYHGGHPGFVRINYAQEGDVYYDIFHYSEGGFRNIWSDLVFQSPTATPIPNIPVNKRLIPVLEDQYVLPAMTGQFPGSKTIVPNAGYGAGDLKRLLLGQHYRASWTTPVDVPYLDLDTVKGGLIPYQIGGGKQTRSLKMVSENGQEFVFRSLDKDASKGLSRDLRQTLISFIVQDQTTTQQPYGALPISNLLDHLGILHPSPALYVMPDDAKLGPFRSEFGNMPGMLEERPSGSSELQETFAGADEIKKSINLFRRMYRDKSHVIDQEEFARARIFDLLIGDWARHENNWKWAGFRTDSGMLYRPIPRDRDDAFSLWEGLLPWLSDREWAKPQGEHFGYEIKGLRSLMYEARHLDRFAGNALERQDWLDAASYIQSRLNDTIISQAVKRMPEKIYQLDGREIAQKLQVRLKDLQVYSNRYYDMLAREVDIPGSVNDEQFEITRTPEGHVTVSVSEKHSKEKQDPYYTRTFYPDETKEVRLFGLQGDDVFRIQGASKKGILLRIMPGSGKDSIIDHAIIRSLSRKNLVYDNESSYIGGTGNSLGFRNPANPEAYQYRRTDFEYDTYLPYGYIFFNQDDGVQFRTAVNFVNYKYGKPDFGSRHFLRLRISTIGNFMFSWNAEWRHVFGTWDLTSGVLYDDRGRFNFFFGLGNGTELDQDLFDDRFYTLRYTKLAAGIGIARSFWKQSSLKFFLSAERNSEEKKPGNIFPDFTPDVPGADLLDIAKLHVILDLDFRNRKHFPTRGMRLYVSGYFSKTLNERLDSYGLISGSLEYFGTAGPFTLGLKGGAAVHHNLPPYYDLFYLGQNTYLRGFRQNRFAGTEAVFFNSDLKIQLLNKRKAIIPYKFGVQLFYDTGRVWIRNEDAATGFHHGYGFGLYFIPLRERYAFTVSAGFSREESFLIRFGLGKSF